MAASLPRSSGTHGKEPALVNGENASPEKKTPVVVSAVILIPNPKTFQIIFKDLSNLEINANATFFEA